MAFTDVNLRNVVFQEVATELGENFIINPFDLNGNVIESINVTVDTTLSGGAVTLPTIASLNPSTNVSVTVILRGSGEFGGLEVYTALDSDDTISGLPNVSVPFLDGANLVFRVAGSNSWALYSPVLPSLA